MVLCYDQFLTAPRVDPNEPKQLVYINHGVSVSLTLVHYGYSWNVHYL